MRDKIAPSMMCADPLSLRQTLETFEASGIEYLHIDIMDGLFVPNYTLGPDYCKALRRGCNIPLDLHLMVQSPEDKLDYFAIQQGDMVSVHAESTHHLQRTLCKIKEKGAAAFVALCPATPLCVLEEVASDIDGVLIMTVNPGFAGQKMIPATLDKIRRLRALYPSLTIEVDGNVSFENARKMKRAGANIFVVGTASIFGKDTSLAEGIKTMRKTLEETK